MQYNVTAANYQAQKTPPPISCGVLFIQLKRVDSKKVVKSFHFSCCDFLFKRSRGRRATCSSFLITKLTMCIFLCLLHAHTLTRMCFAVNWLVCHLENTLSVIRKECLFFLT